jgi:hypothetical protein
MSWLRPRSTSSCRYDTLGRVASGRFGHVLHDQHRRLALVVVSHLDHAKRPLAKRDRVTRRPVRDRRVQRWRLGRGTVRGLGRFCTLAWLVPEKRTGVGPLELLAARMKIVQPFDGLVEPPRPIAAAGRSV